MIKTQTSTPIPYGMLTPEMKKEICNGCGGKGGLVRPPHGVFFVTSCNHHDYGYWKGGSEVDRKRADIRLKERMMEDCDSLLLYDKKSDAGLPWYKRLFNLGRAKATAYSKWAVYRPWCELYYLGVKIAGRKFFRYAPQKRYPDMNA